MLVRWDEKYRVGNEQIEQEHQYLFQLIKKNDGAKSPLPA